MSTTPKAIRQSGADVLEIEWSDGVVSRYGVFDLRCRCPCAGCVDEMTGQRTLDPKTITEDVRPIHLSSVGNYAISIVWSDGHDTGIYSYTRLRELAEST